MYFKDNEMGCLLPLSKSEVLLPQAHLAVYTAPKRLMKSRKELEKLNTHTQPINKCANELDGQFSIEEIYGWRDSSVLKGACHEGLITQVQVPGAMEKARGSNMHL